MPLCGQTEDKMIMENSMTDVRKVPKDSMEEVILHTAEDMFLSNGYNGVSTTDIARKVGCNQALIHYYYRTKQNLFTKVYERKIQSIFDVVKSRLGDGISFEEKIRRVVEIHFDFLMENPRLPLFLLEEARNNEEAIAIIRRFMSLYKDEFMSVLEKSIAAEVERGTIGEISAFDLIMDIASLNVFPFIVNPIVRNIVRLDEEQYRSFLEDRKREVVRLIMSRLKK